MKFPVVVVRTVEEDWDGGMFRKANPRDHDDEMDTTVERLEREERNENIRTGKFIVNAQTINRRIISVSSGGCVGNFFLVLSLSMSSTVSQASQ